MHSQWLIKVSSDISIVKNRCARIFSLRTLEMPTLMSDTVRNRFMGKQMSSRSAQWVFISIEHEMGESRVCPLLEHSERHFRCNSPLFGVCWLPSIWLFPFHLQLSISFIPKAGATLRLNSLLCTTVSPGRGFSFYWRKHARTHASATNVAEKIFSNDLVLLEFICF